jgi:hypothetical protein
MEMHMVPIFVILAIWLPVDAWIGVTVVNKHA